MAKQVTELAEASNIKYDDLIYLRSGVEDNKLSIQNLRKINHKTITDDYSVFADDQLIYINSSINTIEITLPLASDYSGFVICFKVKDLTFSAFLICQSSDSIDADSQHNFTQVNEVITITSDGFNWYII